MKHILLSFIAVLFVASCATTNNNLSVLFQAYSNYRESAHKDNIREVATNYFSQSLLGESYQTNPDAISQLLFKDYMATTDSYYEKIKASNGCLTINGYDEENAPLIFSLKYILNNERWLISEIHVVFIESTSDFSKGARCPGEYID